MATAQDRAETLNKPMLERLRRCAADMHENWDGTIRLFPMEARQLLDLIDAVGGAPAPDVEDRRPIDPYVRPVRRDPDATTAEPCDEDCDADCMHHTPNVGWDLSFDSRLNIGPLSTADPRLAVELHVSGAAVASGMVRRIATEQQVLDYAQRLIELVGGRWKLTLADKE